jgi:hypothetical protein
LALVGAVINEDASCPLGLSRPEIAFPSAHPDEAQTVEIDVAVMALPDVPEQHRLAEAVVRGLGEGAWARNSAAAIVEPVAHNVPVGSFGHKALRSRLTPPSGLRSADWTQCSHQCRVRFSPESNRIADSQRRAEWRFGRGGSPSTLDIATAMYVAPTGARDPIPIVTVLVWIMTRPPTKGGLLSPRT